MKYLALELICIQTGMLLLAVSAFFYLLQFLKPNKITLTMGFGSIILATVSFVATLWIRSINAEYFALSNMYEALLVSTIGLLTAYVIVERWFKTQALGWAVSLLGLLIIVYAFFLPRDINPLIPALQSYWRLIHVPPLLLSYGFFTLAFMSAVAYLMSSRSDNHRLQSTGPDFATRGGNDEHTSISGNSGGGMSFMALAELYDEMTYRCIAAGFPFLTIGVILGAVWANEAWGNYWSWDPKESMSLVTLLWYGVYLHLRINGTHSKKTLAYVAVIGFGLVILTYVGVNVWGLGAGSLHSYGSVK